MYVSISLHWPRFQVMEMEVLSIRKNFDHQSGIDVEEKMMFRIERHVFEGVQIDKMNQIYNPLFQKSRQLCEPHHCLSLHVNLKH